MNFYNLADRALIGAAIGSGLVCLIVVFTLEGRFILEGLMILGSGGLIGGALCSVILGRLSKQTGVVVIGGLIGGIAGCVLAMVSTFFYAAIPWPSPQPYPGVETSIDFGGGSWGPARVQTYTSTLSLDVMQQYYEIEMSRYCADDWQFEDVSGADYQLCRQAECRVTRLGLEQYFRVYICSTSEGLTTISHTDSWQD